MTVLVTGGAGFIGRNFIVHWLSFAGEPVVNLDKLTYASGPPNQIAVACADDYHFIQCGIEEQERVEECLATFGVRAVINFAAETHVDRSIDHPEAFVQTNVVGTLKLLEAVRSYWGQLASDEIRDFRFVQVSTDEVYGSLNPSDAPVAEEAPLRPNNPYAASKAASDHLVRAYGQTYGLPVLTTRSSNNFGPYQFPEKLIPLLIHNALAGMPLPIYGDGQQVRDWLYVEDHCRALRSVLQAGSPGETYNVGGNSERTNLEVVQTICELLDALQPRADGRSYSQQIEMVQDRPGHDRRYGLSSEKLRRQLGWSPLETFETGIRKSVQWCLQNPAWLADRAVQAQRNE